MNINYHTLCMRRCQLLRAVEKIFLFQCQISKKNTQNLPLQLLFLGCGSEPRFQGVSRVPAASVFKERFSWSVLRYIIHSVGNKAFVVSIHLCRINPPLSRSPRALDYESRGKCLLSLLSRLLKPNTKALKERVVCLLSSTRTEWNPAAGKPLRVTACSLPAHTAEKSNGMEVSATEC